GGAPCPGPSPGGCGWALVHPLRTGVVCDERSVLPGRQSCGGDPATTLLGGGTALRRRSARSAHNGGRVCPAVCARGGLRVQPVRCAATDCGVWRCNPGVAVLEVFLQ